MVSHLKATPVLFADIRSYLSYDAATGVFTWIRSVGRRNDVGRVAGQLKAKGYVHIQFAGKVYSAHRLAWFFAYGQMPDKLVDHINTVRSDNRLANLRLATINENARNRRPNLGKALPKGVSFEKRDHRYRAAIRVDGKTIHLGSFRDADSAASAYAEAAVRLHGSFARTA